MIHKGEKISEAAIQRIAEMHIANLRGSIMSFLGLSAVQRYYRFVALSNKEYLFVVRIDDAVHAAAVVSMDTESLMRRYVLSDPFSFAPRTFAALAKSSAFRKALYESVKELFSRNHPQLNMPELLQIFTDSSHQSKGLGAQLLSLIEQHLIECNIKKYFIKTHYHQNEKAIRFYERNGFIPAGSTMFCGDRFLLMTKQIPDQQLL